MCKQINFYFIQFPQQMSRSSKDIAGELTDTVHKALNKDLSKGKVNLPEDDKQHELPVLAKSKISKQDEKHELQMHSIIRKRKMLEQELERVKFDEQVAKQKRPHPMKEIEEGKTRYFRSTITPEQQQKIKKVIKDTKNFERAAALKNIQLQQKIKKEDQEKREAKKSEEKQLVQKRKREAQEKLKQLEHHKIQRTKEILAANRQFQKVSKLKFLHEAIQEKWKIIEEEQKKRNESIIQKLKQKKKFDIGQIKEHARRYSEITIANEEKRQKESQELRASMLEQSRLARHSYSTFFKTINEQESYRKQTMTQRMNLNKVLNSKKAMYAETIRQKNKLSVKKVNSPKVESKTRVDIRSSRSMDNLALNKLGNQYMKQIHSCIDTTPVMHIPIKVEVEENTKYQDYLTKARQSRKLKNPQESQPMELQELKSIINKKSGDKQSRLYRAKAIVARMDQKSGGSSKNLINSIMAKLSLIEQFSQPK